MEAYILWNLFLGGRITLLFLVLELFSVLSCEFSDKFWLDAPELEIERGSSIDVWAEVYLKLARGFSFCTINIKIKTKIVKTVFKFH